MHLCNTIMFEFVFCQPEDRQVNQPSHPPIQTHESSPLSLTGLTPVMPDGDSVESCQCWLDTVEEPITGPLPQSFMKVISDLGADHDRGTTCKIGDISAVNSGSPIRPISDYWFFFRHRSNTARSYISHNATQTLASLNSPRFAITEVCTVISYLSFFKSFKKWQC